jgi:hypothetical protein
MRALVGSPAFTGLWTLDIGILTSPRNVDLFLRLTRRLPVLTKLVISFAKDRDPIDASFLDSFLDACVALESLEIASYVPTLVGLSSLSHLKELDVVLEDGASLAPLASLRNLVTLKLATCTLAVEMAPLSQLMHLTTLVLRLL